MTRRAYTEAMDSLNPPVNPNPTAVQYDTVPAHYARVGVVPDVRPRSSVAQRRLAAGVIAAMEVGTTNG